MSKSKLKLNDRQERFCLEYVKDLNATQAAIRAGYSEKTAQLNASRLLLNVMVQKRIAELQEKRSDELEVDARYVLKRLLEIDQMDVKDILNNFSYNLPLKTEDYTSFGLSVSPSIESLCP